MTAQRSSELIPRPERHAHRTAIVDGAGRHTYRGIVEDADRLATALRDGSDDLRGARVAFLVSPGSDWVRALWGIWRSGGIAVPLCTSHPRPELEYVIEDCGAEILLADPPSDEHLGAIAQARSLRMLSLADALRSTPAPALEIAIDRRAMILYTSGTTGKPKGVVSTHATLQAQIECLVEAWEWTADDRILHVLPLHHVHGIVNVLSCALWSGAVCEMLPAFDANAVWQRFASGELTLFMAVPTIYQKLIAAWERASSGEQSAWSAGTAGLRLMVSGSAALPVPVFDRWSDITGHVLLERYGMTEIGMALSNPLHGERVPGAVGTPLPGVKVRLVDETGSPQRGGEIGEIQVRGPGVFSEYWRRPEETAAAFADGWFQTGDVAVIDGGRYRILGRRSVDILKTGGYKISALEIEDVLLTHPAIAECAVVGVPDLEWGERVGAAVVLTQGSGLALADLRAWAGTRIAPYKIPSRLLIVDALPRNALGKVQKPDVTARLGA